MLVIDMGKYGDGMHLDGLHVYDGLDCVRRPCRGAHPMCPTSVSRRVWCLPNQSVTRWVWYLSRGIPEH